MSAISRTGQWLLTKNIVGKVGFSKVSVALAAAFSGCVNAGPECYNGKDFADGMASWVWSHVHQTLRLSIRCSVCKAIGR